MPTVRLRSALPLCLLAAGCSVPGLQRPDGGTAAASPSDPASSSAVGDDAPHPAVDPAAPGTCERPPQPILEQALAAVASHPGPVTHAASVFAATTATGDWYVLAVERGYVHDDGSPAEGRSRSLALVNTAGARAGDPQVVDIGLGGKSGDVSPDWHRVDWSGPTLEAGRRAARTAIACIDQP